MEAGKHIELSLGQEPGEFRLNLDGMSITIHLKTPNRKEAAKVAAGNSMNPLPAPAPPTIPGYSGRDPKDAGRISHELSYSPEIYEGLGKLAKDINLSIQDLSLAEIIQNATGSPGEHLDQAQNQVTDVLLMTEQTTLNIMDLVEQIREDCQTVQTKLLSLKKSQSPEDLKGAAPESATDSAEQELWDQVLSQAEELDHLWQSAASTEVSLDAGVPRFSLADILQILMEFCTNEKVKQHLKAVQAKQDAIFRATEAERALSLLAAGTPQEAGFHQLPVEPLLNLLKSHSEDERVKELFAKMASSAQKLFSVSALPLEAQEMEEEIIDEPTETQVNSGIVTLWEKLQQNLKLLAERRQIAIDGDTVQAGTIHRSK